jgi:hypothetical protein
LHPAVEPGIGFDGARDIVQASQKGASPNDVEAASAYERIRCRHASEAAEIPIGSPYLTHLMANAKRCDARIVNA